jgi:AraC family transcriptional regulator
MPPSTCQDSRFGQRLAKQYGIDAVPSLVTTSRWGSELGIARMHYDQPHLFVLPPLPSEDAFVLSVEIASGGSRSICKGGATQRLGLQQEGALHIADLSESASAYVCSPFHSMLFHLPRATLDSFAQEMNVPRVARCAATPAPSTRWWRTSGGPCCPRCCSPSCEHALRRPPHAGAEGPCAARLRRRGGRGQCRAARAGALAGAPRQGLPAGAPGRRRVAGRGGERVRAVARPFQQGLQADHGQTPHAWLVSQRVEAARRLLAQARPADRGDRGGLRLRRPEPSDAGVLGADGDVACALAANERGLARSWATPLSSPSATAPTRCASTGGPAAFP